MLRWFSWGSWCDINVSLLFSFFSEAILPDIDIVPCEWHRVFVYLHCSLPPSLPPSPPITLSYTVERPITSFNYSVGPVNDFCIENSPLNPTLITVDLFCRPIPGITPPLLEPPRWNIVLVRRSNGDRFDDALPDEDMYPFISISEDGQHLTIGPLVYDDFSLADFELVFNCRVTNPLNFHDEAITIRECGTCLSATLSCTVVWLPPLSPPLPFPRYNWMPAWHHQQLQCKLHA